MNALLTTTLLKIQASLNEHILFYLKLANKTGDITNFNINQFLKCALDLDDDFLAINKNNLRYMGYWFIDKNIHESDLGFLRRVYNNALYVADYLNWDIVSCSCGQEMMSIEEVHDKVYRIVK